jgi:hypothetical protein
MATIPATQSFLAGERVTASKLNAAAKTPLDFLMAPPRCKVRQAGTQQSITSGTETQISFDTEMYDNDNMYASSAADRITINTAGYYLVVGVYSFANGSNVTGYRRMSVYANGTLLASNTAPPVATNQYMEASGIVYFNAGDNANMKVIHTAGVAISGATTAYYPALAVHYLSQ